jgi:hypothetical protein
MCFERQRHGYLPDKIMIIKLKNTENNSWTPDLRRVLNTDFQIPLYYSNHKFRHPRAIYNVSYSTVIEKLHDTIVTLYQVMGEKLFLDPKNYEWDINLLTKQKDLLYTLMEHLDDCENILACFISPSDNRNKNPYVRSFKKAIKEYQDHIGKIVNHIKHEQGRIRSIVFINDKLAMPGYFIENAVGENAIGPVEKIHPNGQGAFSFARDLRYHFFYFHAVAESLGDAIIKFIGSEPISGTSTSEQTDYRVLDIAKAISEIPLAFYPDEILKPIPTVVVSTDDELGPTITLTYPDKKAVVDKFWGLYT